MEINTDAFKAKNPLEDLMFWICVAVAVPMIIAVLKTAFDSGTVDESSMLMAATPLLGYLARNGYVSGRGVQAYGIASSPQIQNLNFPLTQSGVTEVDDLGAEGADEFESDDEEL